MFEIIHAFIIGFAIGMALTIFLIEIIIIKGKTPKGISKLGYKLTKEV